jgi:hypothetical protein
MTDLPLQQRAEAYAALLDMALDCESPLGHGTDGSVWKSSARTAVKAFIRQANYNMELACYQRLSEHKIVKLDGFAVPKLMGFDDALCVIEMAIVTPPFILDFAKCRLDLPMEFEESGMEAWQDGCKNLFEDNWPKVRSVLYSLWQLGIYYYDAKPANIMFKDTGT